MSNLIKLPDKKEEEVIEVEEEKKDPEPIFKEEKNENLNIEPVIEKVEEKKTKPKRSRNMSEAAKKQLDNARLKSIETRKANALKRKQEKEEK